MVQSASLLPRSNPFPCTSRPRRQKSHHLLLHPMSQSLPACCCSDLLTSPAACARQPFPPTRAISTPLHWTPTTNSDSAMKITPLLSQSLPYPSPDRTRALAATGALRVPAPTLPTAPPKPPAPAVGDGGADEVAGTSPGYAPASPGTELFCKIVLVLLFLLHMCVSPSIVICSRIWLVRPY